MSCDPFRSISTIMLLNNSINRYKRKNIVRPLYPYKMELFGQPNILYFSLIVGAALFRNRRFSIPFLPFERTTRDEEAGCETRGALDACRL